jgi:hypothetical protein
MRERGRKGRRGSEDMWLCVIREVGNTDHIRFIIGVAHKLRWRGGRCGISGALTGRTLCIKLVRSNRSHWVVCRHVPWSLGEVLRR